MSDQLTEDPNLYKSIAIVITAAFVIDGVCLVILNIDSAANFLKDMIGERSAFFVQIYFWGTSGATIAASLFMANDKEINVNEKKKSNPDPLILQYPDKIDVWLYVQRIISSGFLAIFGAVLIFTGLGYFDVSVEMITAKHQTFLIVFAVIIGLFENKFVGSLDKLSKKMFQKAAGD